MITTERMHLQSHDQCEFFNSLGAAVVAALPGSVTGGQGMQASLDIVGCKFDSCSQLLWTQADVTTVTDTWVLTQGGTSTDRALIVQAPLTGSAVGGVLRLTNLVGACNYTLTPTNPAMRWIDCSSHLYVEKCRFGGDGGSGGMPIVYFNAPISDPDVPTGVVVEIRNSGVFTGTDSGGPTIPNIAVMNISGGCPGTFIYEGNSGPAIPTHPIVQVTPGSGYALGTYLAGYPNLRPEFRIQDNSPSSLGRPAVPAELIPFINPVSSPPFHAGARAGAPVTGHPTQSSYTYFLPSSLNGFVALVTVSVNVANTASANVRQAATYFVSLTSNSTTDYLLFTPIYQPTTAGIGVSPEIIAVVFGTSPSGSSTRPCMGGQDSNFTIVWDSHSPTGVTVTSSYISIQPIHLIT